MQSYHISLRDLCNNQWDQENPLHILDFWDEANPSLLQFSLDPHTHTIMTNNIAKIFHFKDTKSTFGPLRKSWWTSSCKTWFTHNFYSSINSRKGEENKSENQESKRKTKSKEGRIWNFLLQPTRAKIRVSTAIAGPRIASWGCRSDLGNETKIWSKLKEDWPLLTWLIFDLLGRHCWRADFVLGGGLGQEV